MSNSSFSTEKEIWIQHRISTLFGAPYFVWVPLFRPTQGQFDPTTPLLSVTEVTCYETLVVATK